MEPIPEPSSPLLSGRRVPKKTKKSLRNAGSQPSPLPPPLVSSTHTADISQDFAEDVTTLAPSHLVPTVQPAVLQTALDENSVVQATTPTLPVVSASATKEIASVESSTAPEVDSRSVAAIHSKHYVHSNEKIP